MSKHKPPRPPAKPASRVAATPAPAVVPAPAPVIDQAGVDQAAKAGKMDFMHSRLMPSWLAQNQVSLAFTTYHANRVFFIGLSPKGTLSVSAQTLPRCMGLWASADAQTLYLSHLFQVMRFESTTDTALAKKGIDRVYAPRHSFTTGDCDIHDIAADTEAALRDLRR